MECRVVKKPREPKGVRNKKTLTPWNGVVDNPEDYEGFVYCITRNDGKYYVGMKFTKSRRRVKQKDSARRKRVEKDSDWKHYKGSSKELLKDIKQLGQEAFDFTILGWYKTRSGVRYAEMREQVRNDVLNDPNSYNSNVMNRFFKGNIE